MDPAVVVGALVTAVTTLAGILYRREVQRGDAAVKDATFWRDKYIEQLGKTHLALDEAERRRK